MTDIPYDPSAAPTTSIPQPAPQGVPDSLPPDFNPTVTNGSARFYRDQATRIRLVAASNPLVSNIPGLLNGVASSTTPTQDLLSQASAMAGTASANMSAEQLGALPPAVQRVLFSKMPTASQQALVDSGFNVPQVPKDSTDQGLLGYVGDVVGGAASVLGNLTAPIKPVLNPVLQGLNEMGQVPADAYRAIRTSDSLTQWLALGGAIAATALTAGTGAPLGLALLGESGALTLGGSALVGAYGTAGVINTIRGNPDFWGQAFQWGDAGERTWAQHTLDHAAGILNGDGDSLEMAKSMSVDLMGLAEDTAGHRGASLDDANVLPIVAKYATRAGQPGTPEYQAAYQKLADLTQAPAFRQAVQALVDGKISFGRDVADLLHLSQGSTPYDWVSGAGDAFFQVTTDPALLLGRALKVSRAARFGVEEAMKSGGYVGRIESLANNSSVDQAWTHIAQRLEANQAVQLGQEMKGAKELISPMYAWQATHAPDQPWTKDLVTNFFKSQDGLTAITNGKAASSVHGMLEVPHLNSAQAVAMGVKSQIRGIVNVLDDANISFRLTAPPGVLPDLDTYNQLNGLSKTIVNVLDGIPGVREVPRNLATLGKTLTTTVPKYGWLALDPNSSYAGDLTQQVRNFTDLGRVAGLPSAVRDEMANAILGSGSVAQRRAALESFQGTMFDLSGMRSTTEGQEIADRYLEHFHQALVGNTASATAGKDSASLIAIPDMREMRMALRQNMLNKVLNAGDANWVTAATGKIWKPAVLLRIGFIPRVLGDEMASFIANHGLRAYTDTYLAKHAFDPDSEFFHAEFVNSAVRSLTKPFPNSLSDPIQSWVRGHLDDYTDRLTQLMGNGFMPSASSWAYKVGDDLEPTSTFAGRLLLPPGTVRNRLAFGFSQQEREAAQSFFNDARVRQGLISAVGAAHASVLADAARPIGGPLTLDADGKLVAGLPHNPTNSYRALTEADPEVRAAAWSNQRNAMMAGSEANAHVDWLAANPGRRVRSHLDADSINQLITDNEHIVSPDARRLVSVLALDNPQQRQALVDLTERLYPQTTIAQRLRNLPPGTDVREFLSNETATNWAADLASKIANASNGDMAAQRYAAMMFNRSRPILWAPEAASGTEWAQRAMDEVALPHVQAPKYQSDVFSRLDNSRRGALSGMPVASPVDAGMPRFFAPSLGPKGTPFMQALLAAPENKLDEVAHAYGVTLTAEEKHAIFEMGDKVKAPLRTAGAQYDMVVNDPKMARLLTNVAARADGELEGPIAEFPLPQATLGRKRYNHGLGWASDPVDYSNGAWGYHLDPWATPDPIVYPAGFPQVGGVPGLTTDQALREHAEAVVNYNRTLFHGPTTPNVDFDPEVHLGHRAPQDPDWNAWASRHEALVRSEKGMVEGTGPIAVKRGATSVVTIDPDKAAHDFAAGAPWIRGDAYTQDAWKAKPATDFAHGPGATLHTGHWLDLEPDSRIVEGSVGRGHTKDIAAALPDFTPGDASGITYESARPAWEAEFNRRQMQALAEEKASDPATWTAEQKAAYRRGDHVEFSRLRGYSDAEIANHERYQEMAKGTVPSGQIDYPAGSPNEGSQAAVSSASDAFAVNGPGTPDRAPHERVVVVSRNGHLGNKPMAQDFATKVDDAASSGAHIVIPDIHANRQVMNYLDEQGVPYTIQTEGTHSAFARAREVQRTPLDQIVTRPSDNVSFEAGTGWSTDGHHPEVIINKAKLATAFDRLSSGEPLQYFSALGIHPGEFMDELDRYGARYGMSTEEAFNDWVKAREQGRWAAGGYGPAPSMTGESTLSAQALRTEQAAVTHAFNDMGIMQGVTRDPRSARLAGAMARVGLDPAQVVDHFQGGTTDDWGTFLQDLELRRMVAGDNFQGDLGALRDMAGHYDLPIADARSITPAGLDPVPEPLWETIAPLDIEKGSGLPIAHPSDIDAAPSELHPRMGVKEQEVIRREPTRMQKLVSWSFDKVATANDKIIREPLALHNYMKAYQDGLNAAKFLRDPVLFGEGSDVRALADKVANDTGRPWTQLSNTEQSEIMRAGRILGMGSVSSPGQVLNYADRARNATHLELQGYGDLANLVRGTTIQGHADSNLDALMGAFRNAGGNKNALSNALGYELNDSEFAKLADAVGNDTVVSSHVPQMAMQRSITDTVPFIDDHKVRSQFQNYANNLTPFWYAEDQFMRRWWRTAVFDPSVLRKAQLLHHGLQSSGYVTTDANGQETFVYPGSKAFMEVVGSLPFLSSFVPVPDQMTGKLNMVLPGLSRFGQPSISPFVALPLNQLSSVLPELHDVSNALTGQEGPSRAIWRQLVPTHMQRFADAFNNDSRAMSAAMMSAAQILEANGNGLPDNATSDQLETYLDRLRGHARTVLLAQAMFGFLAPASPGLQQGTNLDNSLHESYLTLIRNLGVEAGTTEFLKRNPDATPSELTAWKVAQSTSPSGAPIPPTQAAVNFYETNKDWMSQYRDGSPWLLPPQQGPGDQGMPLDVYQDQMAVGLRAYKAPLDYVRELKFQAGVTAYKDQSDKFDALIASAKTVPQQAQLEQYKAAFQQQYLQTHPVFNEEWTSSDRNQRRSRVLDDLRLAAQDPATPTSWSTSSIFQMVDALDRYQAADASLANRQGVATRRKRDQLKQGFSTWGTQFIAAHPEASALWQGIVKPTAGV